MKDLKNILKPKILHFFTYSGHDFDHTERVYNLAIKIAKEEKADMEIIQASALLHDIGRKKEALNPKVCHAEESAKIASKILKSIKFPKNKIKAVLEAIKKHRYSRQIKPKNIEEAIIQDADRLDAIGCIGIARVFQHSGAIKTPIYNPKIKPEKKYSRKNKNKTAVNHFYEKIFKITPNTFHTKLARKIATKRYKFTKEFIKKLEKEWVGKI